MVLNYLAIHIVCSVLNLHESPEFKLKVLNFGDITKATSIESYNRIKVM